jgi:hypothetical protein
MQKRPFISHSIDNLEEAFERADKAGDRNLLTLIARELRFRKTPRARELCVTVDKARARDSRSGTASTQRPSAVSQQLPISLASAAAAGAGTSAGKPTPSKAAGRGKSTPKLKHSPTPEQEQASSFFRQGGSLKINAYAGAGKTSTLEMLAHATGRRGQYLAFNRDIVADARKRFPETVACNTTHSLAYKAVVGRYRGDEKKLTGRINANQLAEIHGFKTWRIDKDHTLQPRSQGFLILDTVRRFAMSADPEPLAAHVPKHGSLLAAPTDTLSAVNDFAVRGARHVWAQMQAANDAMPLGHDGYLKLWALSNPMIAADFVLMDEAQDTNPVVLDLLKSQPAQMIYVGDKYQQIYEWRGAVNAMEAIDTNHETFLSTSFRFGEGIAEGASKLLSLLGESRPLRGNPAANSRIGPTPNAGTVLARTNAYTITAVIEAIDAGRRPHLIGGSDELVKMLRGVTDLKRGDPSDIPDFFGFAKWQEVIEFARSGEGEHLQTFVNLVETRGEKQLLWALGRVVEADESDLVISTAHKAKGREWSTVRLMDDFIKSQPRRGPDGEPGAKRPLYEASELRLLYVALTRAKVSIEVPPPLLTLLGLPASLGGNSPVRAAAPSNGRTHEPNARTHAPRPAGSSVQSAPSPPLSKSAWAPPKNWKPEPPPPPSPTQQNPKPAQDQPKPPKRRGLLGWLLGS